MGITFRKSVSMGPLRFNLSKSGIGMSAGVKGLRVGTGARGGYVRAGRGGIVYQQTLGSRQTPRAPRRATPGESLPAPVPVETALPALSGNLEADVADLVAASPSDIVRRIQDAAALPKPKMFPNPFSHKRRKLQWDAERAVPLFYELDDYVYAVYEAMVERGEALGRSPGRYYDADQQRTDSHSQYKGHGGAGALLDRKQLEVRTAGPPAVTLNFEPLEFVGVGRSVFLLPDQVLVQQGNQYGVVQYSDLKVKLSRSQFITDRVPPGVQPVGQTWKYLNKSGGPDRRYKDNRQIPIIAVTEIDLYGPAGFQFHTAFTDEESGRSFVEALKQLATSLPPVA